METRQNQFLFAGIGIDVAHREDTRLAGLELFRIDLLCLLFELKTPFRNGSELWM